MEQKTILDTIKELVKQKADIIEAINKSTRIAFVVEPSIPNTLLTDNKRFTISEQLKNKIFDCFEANNRECIVNSRLACEDKDNKGNTVKKWWYYCNGAPYNEPQYNDINDKDLKQKINIAIEKTPMSGPFSDITVNNGHIRFSQEINNDSTTMCHADITTDINGKIEKIELHYTDNVEIQNQKQLQELNELLNNSIQKITEKGIDINNIMVFLSALTKKENQVDIDKNIKDKFNFIYDTLLKLNREYDGIKNDVKNLQNAIQVPSGTNKPINIYYLSLKAIKQEFPKYKNDIDTAIKSISSKIDKFKTNLQNVNANEKIEATLNEMKKNLYDTEFEIGPHGIEYKPNENKIIQSNGYSYYDDNNKCFVNNMVEIKLDPQYNIEYLSLIDKTKNKNIKILPNIPFYINGKKFHLEDCILHHNAGFGTKWIDGWSAENAIKTTEQFEQIKKQQIIEEKQKQRKIKKIKDTIKQDKKFNSATISKMFAPKNIVERIKPKTTMQQVIYNTKTKIEANNKNR